MKIKVKLFIVIVVGAIAGFGSYLLLSYQTDQGEPIYTQPDLAFGWKYPVAKFPAAGPVSNQIAYSDIRDPGGIPQGLPVRLKIPVIGVNSAIEDALITPDGRMDVPYGSVNVAWFALGPHPGQEGSAVIGGHFGIRNGIPFVFYNLDKLKIGDKIYIVDDKSDTLAFIVRSIKLFDRNADATSVFTSDDEIAHLNLITCEGIWNQVNGTYPERRIVFTDAISAEGASEAFIDFPRTLSIGARGTDVTTLQTFLIEKGLLKMPIGIVKGYFGALTRSAIAKYQTSVGLPATGVFNLAVRAKLISEQTKVVINPELPLTAITPEPLSVSQIFIRSVKSLYATPIDGLITILLLVSVTFIVFKITRILQRRSL